MKYKIKLVKQIYINGALFSKAEKAAWAYSKASCQEWWQKYLIAYKAANPPLSPSVRLWSRSTAHGVDATLLKARETKLYKRVLPIFKKMLAE